jgi:hypothetical protein
MSASESLDASFRSHLDFDQHDSDDLVDLGVCLVSWKR